MSLFNGQLTGTISESSVSYYIPPVTSDGETVLGQYQGSRQ
ncbi:hypothetical protein [Neptunicella sp.]